jgi:hypothetical protein
MSSNSSSENSNDGEIMSCIPVTISNEGETTPVQSYSVDENYSNDTQKMDFMKTVVIFGSVLFVIVIAYNAIPVLYKHIIIDNIIINSATDLNIDNINFIGGVDLFIAIAILTVILYNFIIGASTVSDNEPTNSNTSGNIPLETDGYQKIIFSFASGFFFIFSALLIYNRKLEFLGAKTDVLINAYKDSLNLTNFKTVFLFYFNILIGDAGYMPGIIIFVALFMYYIILIILSTAQGTKDPYWIEEKGVGKFKGNDIITLPTFIDCCAFYPFVIVIPVFAAIGYLVTRETSKRSLPV